jgi:cold shock CspA family protein
MGRSQETWNKREHEKRKRQKKQEKEARKEERKARGGNSFEIAYVDEFGNITSEPPDPAQRTEVDPEEISINVPRDTAPEEPALRTGVVTFYNDSKGYGFIRDGMTKESIFVHARNVAEPLHENLRVSYEVEKGPRGLSAINVKVAR